MDVPASTSKETSVRAGESPARYRMETDLKESLPTEGQSGDEVDAFTSLKADENFSSGCSCARFWTRATDYRCDTER